MESVEMRADPLHRLEVLLSSATVCESKSRYGYLNSSSSRLQCLIFQALGLASDFVSDRK
jgi:hypothetical protein